MNTCLVRLYGQPLTCASLPVQAALEQSLTAQLRTAVAQPLQDGFRASFQGTLLPAFESACQTMFSQAGALTAASPALSSPLSAALDAANVNE